MPFPASSLRLEGYSYCASLSSNALSLCSFLSPRFPKYEKSPDDSGTKETREGESSSGCVSLAPDILLGLLAPASQPWLNIRIPGQWRWGEIYKTSRCLGHTSDQLSQIINATDARGQASGGFVGSQVVVGGEPSGPILKQVTSPTA